MTAAQRKKIDRALRDIANGLDADIIVNENGICRKYTYSRSLRRFVLNMRSVNVGTIRADLQNNPDGFVIEPIDVKTKSM